VKLDILRVKTTAFIAMTPHRKRIQFRLPRPSVLLLGGVLLLLFVTVLSVGIPALRTLQFVREMERYGGAVEFDDFGPNWLPKWVVFKRPVSVWFLESEIDNRILAKLATVSTLDSLVCGGETITDEGLAQLRALPALEALNLRANVSGEGLRGLNGLTSLTLASRRLSHEGMAAIRKMNRLKHLRLLEASMSDNDLEHLKGLGELEYLVISGAQITDEGLKYLGGLKKLTDLTIRDASFDGNGLFSLQPLSNLERLQLPGCRVTDAALESIGKLSQLQLFELTDTELTDDDLKHFNMLTNLWHLDLDGTQVTGTGLVHLSMLTKLREIILFGTPFTDQNLQHVDSVPVLDHLDVRHTKVTEGGARRYMESRPRVGITY
jgi:hypothetical protein